MLNQPSSPFSFPPNGPTPIRRYYTNKDPTTADHKGFKIGEEWHNESNNSWWKLSGKTPSSASWDKITGIGSSGGVLQIVNTNYSTYSNTTAVIPFDGTIPQQTEGTEVVTLSITPTKATNILAIEFTGCLGIDSAGIFLSVALFQDAAANALATTACENESSSGVQTMQLKHTMTAGTTSPTVFKIRYGTSNAIRAAYINGNSAQPIGAGNAYFSITEYA